MNDSLSLTYTLTVDDAVAWNQYHRSHSALHKRSLRIWRILLSAVVLGVIVAFTRCDAIGIGVALITAGIYYSIFPRLWERSLTRYSKKAYMEATNKDTDGQCRLVIADDRLVVSSAAGQDKTTWAGIERIVEIPGYTFIYFGAVQANVIPERGVSEGNYSAFVAELKRRWETAQKEQATA